MDVNDDTRARKRLPLWAWVVIGLGAAVVLVLASPVILVMALVVLVTAVVGLAKGTPTWLRFRSPTSAGIVLASAIAAVVVTAPMASVWLPDDSTRAAATAERGDTSAAARLARAATASPTPTPTPTPVVTTSDEIVVEAIAFERTTAEDAALAKGQTRVSAGQDGQRSLTYRVTRTDGVESGRELVSDVVTIAPVAEVTITGTYVAPPPPPPPAAPSGCDSNYADACVPIDSDVDCAGGSGNGPSYFSGVARVVGVDVYDLDRDKDGYACEP